MIIIKNQIVIVDGYTLMCMDNLNSSFIIECYTYFKVFNNKQYITICIL